MAKMYLMSGCSGVGKTTFAKKFAEENGILYLGTDEFYALINGDETIHENEFAVWISMYQAIHAAEVNGRDCIIDTNALTVVDRDQFLEWFPSFEHHLIYIKADEELRRVNNSSRRRQVPEEEMKKMWRRLQEPEWWDLDVRWLTFTCICNVDNHFVTEGVYPD